MKVSVQLYTKGRRALLSLTGRAPTPFISAPITKYRCFSLSLFSDPLALSPLRTCICVCARAREFLSPVCLLYRHNSVDVRPRRRAETQCSRSLGARLALCIYTRGATASAATEKGQYICIIYTRVEYAYIYGGEREKESFTDGREESRVSTQAQGERL